MNPTPILTAPAPEQKECPECRVSKPLTAFGKNKAMRDGVQFYCRDCANRLLREWKQANPEKTARSQRKYYDKNKTKKNAACHRIRQRRVAALVAQFKSAPCMDCKQSFPPYVMDFDHRPGTDKKFNLAGTRLNRYSLAATLDEIAKCDLVCSNCHRVRTHQRRMEARI